MSRRLWVELRAARAYRPRRLSGRVTLLRARVRLLLSDHDPALGWDALADGGVEFHHLPGRYKEMFNEPDVRTLAARLACLLY